MSVSCVGTCSNCGVRRFWLSDTLSLQLDDGRLKCLPHPAESHYCEKEGLTLAQASDRGRLFRETFFVCRNCGRDGETIEKRIEREWETFTVGEAMTLGLGLAVIVLPFLAWMRWWDGIVGFGVTLLASPGIYWWENRKARRALSDRGLPRPDAPGRVQVAEPTAGCGEAVVGRVIAAHGAEIHATGPCCANPDWIKAAYVRDEDRIPCCSCGKGLMTVSEHAIH